jgi:hypothetical protein
MQFITLVLAQEDSRMPLPKAVLLFLLCLLIGLASLIGVFLPAETLRKFSHVIGTENPLVSRIVCLLGAIIGLAGTAAFGASLLGYS